MRNTMIGVIGYRRRGRRRDGRRGVAHRPRRVRRRGGWHHARQVAGDPAAYAGDQVTVSGEIAENDSFSPADAGVVFAIGDDADGRLLVYPQPAADVPALDESTVVRVRGTVEVAEPQATSPDGFVDRGGLLAASGATAVVLAEQIAIVARNPNEPPPAESIATTTTISRLLAEPDDFSDGPVKIPGRVSALLPSGFVLAANGGRIFVGAPRSSQGGTSAVTGSWSVRTSHD